MTPPPAGGGGPGGGSDSDSATSSELKAKGRPVLEPPKPVVVHRPPLVCQH
jgi:hypothetical protein